MTYKRESIVHKKIITKKQELLSYGCYFWFHKKLIPNIIKIYFIYNSHV